MLAPGCVVTRIAIVNCCSTEKTIEAAHPVITDLINLGRGLRVTIVGDTCHGSTLLNNRMSAKLHAATNNSEQNQRSSLFDFDLLK